MAATEKAVVLKSTASLWNSKVSDKQWTPVQVSQNEDNASIFSNSKEMTLFRTDTQWMIVDRILRLVAYAISFGMHPVTVYKGEWMVSSDDGITFQADPTFAFSPGRESSEKEPYSMSEIGIDFFIRNASCQSSFGVIWYVDPQSRHVYHSGTKFSGRKYCHLCQLSLSSHNFYHQHLRKHDIFSQVLDFAS